MLSLEEIQKIQTLPIVEKAEYAKRIIASFGEMNAGQWMPCAQVAISIIDDMLRDRRS